MRLHNQIGRNGPRARKTRVTVRFAVAAHGLARPQKILEDALFNDRYSLVGNAFVIGLFVAEERSGGVIGHIEKFGHDPHATAAFEFGGSSLATCSGERPRTCARCADYGPELRP